MKVILCAALALVLSNAFSPVSSLKEFSLARFSATAVYANNSAVDIQLVGEGYPGITQTDGGALECHTDDTTCCRGIDNPDGPGRGEWYYPDGTVVPPPGDEASVVYRTRDHMVIRLNRRALSLPPPGVYRCVIPGAGGVDIVRHITLNSGDTCTDLPMILNGTVIYTPPRHVSAILLPDRRYIGTIATYSCSPGYQLVGGSSLRACIPSPSVTWNGTEPSCQIEMPTTEAPTTTYPTTASTAVTTSEPTTTELETTTPESVTTTGDGGLEDPPTADIAGPVAGALVAVLIVIIAVIIVVVIAVVFRHSKQKNYPVAKNMPE